MLTTFETWEFRGIRARDLNMRPRQTKQKCWPLDRNVGRQNVIHCQIPALPLILGILLQSLIRKHAV